MKNIFTILKALLIVTGLKAQKATVQEETVKPKVDTLVKSNMDKQSKADKKGMKITSTVKYA